MKQTLRRIFWLAPTFLILFFLSSSFAYAQSRSVTVEQRNADISIRQSDGAVEFNETWVVRFDGGPFRFAFRCIPTDRLDRIGGDWRVSENGREYSAISTEAPNTFDTYSDDNGQRCIKWFFPASTNQTRTFNLEYIVYGGLRVYPDGDQFYWKFIESDRQYDIVSSSVTLRIPGDAEPSQIKATTYRNGADNPQAARVVDGSTVVFTGRNFSAGDEWEVRAQFPHGIVNATASAWQTAEDSRRATEPLYNFLALAVSALALIGGGLGLYLLWFSAGRDRPAGVVAEFYPAPPTNDPPAVAGVLIDERADMQDIVATIVDLARRGVIRMTEKNEPGFLGIGSKRDFTFERVSDSETGLREYEKTLLDKLFGSRQERDLEDLKNKFYKYLPEIKKEMYAETVKAGYYNSSPQATRTRFSVLGVAALIALGCIGFVAFGALVDITPLAACVLVSFGLVGAGLLILAQFMPKRTDKGSTETAKWHAFKRYLANIEKYTNVAQAKDQFDKYLPYAIAFGLENSWVNKFAAVDTPAPPWYYPYGGYGYGRTYGGGTVLTSGPSSSGGGDMRMPSLNEASAAGFRGLNSMSDGLFSMLNSTSSVFTSAPSSSGGGGGGGSSGFG